MVIPLHFAWCKRCLDSGVAVRGLCWGEGKLIILSMIVLMMVDWPWSNAIMWKMTAFMSVELMTVIIRMTAFISLAEMKVK